MDAQIAKPSQPSYKNELVIWKVLTFALGFLFLVAIGFVLLSQK